jgi:hypothetical protein
MDIKCRNKGLFRLKMMLIYHLEAEAWDVVRTGTNN